MKNLIPHFIQKQYQSDVFQGRMQAFTMFIDLSGFTPLTEGLMREGTKGAEQLSVILNEIFSPLVSLVYARGGFIPYYAGDAFTAIFPTEDTQNDPIEFARTAVLLHDLFSQRQYQSDDFNAAPIQIEEFTIGMKMGLSFGEVEWGIVGKDHLSFYFRGKPIDSCAHCHIIAKEQKTDIVLDELLQNQLKDFAFELNEVVPGYYRIDEKVEIKDIPLHPEVIPSLLESVAKKFLPSSVVKYNQDGEFRTVIAIFISFQGIENHESLDYFASLVLEQMNNFSGYFKEIDFGDKGGVIMGFFGAPVSFENNLDRALEFILAVNKEVNNHPEINSIKFRAALSLGTAYTGIIGGQERCQYAAVGNRINLGARLMTYADWGEILVDEEISKTRQYLFDHKGDIKYKGIKGTVPTFKLIGRDREDQSIYQGYFIGREEEFERLLNFSQPLFDGKTAGIAYIYGEAGIGKSRLLHELRQTLPATKNIKWFICQADQILKKPFNPFIYFLKNYFEQSPEGTTPANEAHFEQKFQLLNNQLSKLETAEAERIRRELNRTKTVLGALVGINYPNSLWEQLDAKGRYENNIAAINNLIIAEALISPLVLVLEDAHWIDDNSRDLVVELVKQIHHYPVMILVTVRPKDDGSRTALFDKRLIATYELQELSIDLSVLAPASVRTFAEYTLNGKISDEFYDLLLRTTNSNPFYLEQILEYFSESELLEMDNNEWTIKDKNVKLSSSINSILTARIDRLSTLVKETVKAAAVIGREFDLPVLSEVMKVQEEFSKRNGNSPSLLKEQIKKAEKVQILLAMNELRYIFRQSLLREAVYSMQLRTRVMQLHQLIAQAIERLYGDNLEERYMDLAFHYELAGVFDKTCDYLRKAADYARANYQNQQALNYYEKLLKKLGQQKDVEDEIQTYLKKGKVLELIGQWDDCQDAYEKALRLAKKSRDVVLLGQANNSLGRLLLLKGDYLNAMSYLQTAAGLFESIEDQEGIAKVYGNLGNLYFRQGKYFDAKSYFEQSISIGNELVGAINSAQIVANLGLTFMNQGKFEEGIQCQEDYLEICKSNNDKQGMATLYTNIGIVYFEKGDHEAALKSYEKGLALAEELGNKLLTSIATGCIGSVYERKGDYETAMEHFEDDLRLCEELGDKQGTAIALGLIGELHSITGNFHKAIEFLQKNLMLSEELGYQKGIAKALNTLGDVFYFTNQLERSLEHYDRAIEVTRRINNRLVLGMSLVEKGDVLIQLGRIDDLDEVFREALEIAEDLGNPDLLFEAKMLAAKAHVLEGETKKALSILHGSLLSEISKDQEAAVYFELYEVSPEKSKYKDKALALYQQLYKETPRYLYKMRLKTLE